MNIRIITMILILIVTGSFLYIRDQLSHKTISPETAEQFSIRQTSANQQNDQGSDVTPTDDNTHYLFDLVDHDPDQIKQLLQRAESLSRSTDTNDQQSRIAMVIHGPDIEFFDKKNYAENKELIDLAARLDASDIIDFKVCKVTADSRGISGSSFPSFMEIVPFAPDEIDRLENDGYVEL